MLACLQRLHGPVQHDECVLAGGCSLDHMRGHAHAHYRPERALAPLDPRSQLDTYKTHQWVQLTQKLDMSRSWGCDLVLESATLRSARCAVQRGESLQAVAPAEGPQSG